MIIFTYIYTKKTIHIIHSLIYNFYKHCLLSTICMVYNSILCSITIIFWTKIVKCKEIFTRKFLLVSICYYFFNIFFLNNQNNILKRIVWITFNLIKTSMVTSEQEFAFKTINIVNIRRLASSVQHNRRILFLFGHGRILECK